MCLTELTRQGLKKALYIYSRSMKMQQASHLSQLLQQLKKKTTCNPKNN